MFALSFDMLVMLCGATVLAAMLQTATGMGFGLIAGPFVLMALQGRDAIEATALLGLLIALVLAPKLRSDINWRDLLNLSLGCAAGLPMGLLVYLYADVLVLKLGAAVMISLVLSTMFFPVRARAGHAGEPSRVGGIATGILTGILGASLAMPGPAAAVFLVRQGRGKLALRATLLAFLVVSLSAVLGLQIIVDGFPTKILEVTALLAPACVIGLILGNFAVTRISENAFRRLLKLVLAGTVLSLLASSYGDLNL